MYLVGLLCWLLGMAVAVVWLLRRRRQVRLQPQHRRWIDLGLAGWMVLAALTLLEVAVAGFYDESDSFDLTNVSKRWFVRHVQLNPQGFRDTAPFTRLVPEGRQRIVFIGDSFTFGHGVRNVADRFSDRVAAGLQHAYPGEYVISNLGRSGIGANDLIPLWRQAVVETDSHVDLAYYVICLNDIEWFVDDNNARYMRLAAGAPQWFPFKQTYAYNLLYYRWAQIRSPQIRSYYADLQDHYSGAPWERMAAELDRFRALLKTSRTELRLVIFPFLHNLGAEYPFGEAHTRILQYAQQFELHCVDLVETLSEHADESLTVNRFDAHPNARAHRYAAEAILQDLADHPPQVSAASSAE